MQWKSRKPNREFSLTEAVEIDAPSERVFARWCRYEDFPRFMDSVRRTKCVHERLVLWDADISGHQVVWEARIVEIDANKRIRWESASGASNRGEVRFEALPGARTLVVVELSFGTSGPLEAIGGHLGLVDRHVRRDLERFRLHVEDPSSDH